MRHKLCILGLAAACGSAFAGPSAWQSAPSPLGAAADPFVLQLDRYASFKADPIAFANQLAAAPMENPMNGKAGSEVLLPSPDGSVKRFRLVQSPMQSPEVERQTGLKTYAVQGIDDPWAYGRFGWSRAGLTGVVLTPNGNYFVQPLGNGNQVDHIAFFRGDVLGSTAWQCLFKETKSRKSGLGDILPMPLRPGPNRKEYRLALKGTGEYTAVFGGVAGADTNSANVMNMVNAVYIVDMAIRMNITNLVNYTNAGTDPYDNFNGFTMLSQNQATCDANPGNANYDIGHVFSTGGGGIAGLGVVGVTGQKARGVTGLPNPSGTVFAIDFVAHEMGHQYGANHTFNGTTSNCGGGNRSAAHAYEPGSGSTVMAYAGICGAENVQGFSDPYFHTESQREMELLRPGNGGTVIGTDNISPTINAGADYTIPRDTPFRLTGVGADGNGDPLTYCWEQFDLGAATPPVNEASGPLFRSLTPTTSPTRWFPKQATVINNITDIWENLPSVNRTMNFRCTVRDSRPVGGNFEWDLCTITVNGNPFTVTAPNTAVSWAGLSTQTVTWNVGGSTSANVRILLSTNGGNSFFNGTATTILASTPNDGSESITVPNTPGTQNRIIVEGVGNIFYDMSNVNFTITAPVSQTVNPSAFTVNSGSLLGGTLSSLFTSDDNRLVLLMDEFDPNSNLEIVGTSPLLAVSRIDFILETRSSRNDLTQFTDQWNYQTNGWENVDVRSTTLNDSSFTEVTTTTPGRFVNGANGQVRTRMRTIPQVDMQAVDGWSWSVDRSVWIVYP